jgi:hypothetical protein
MAPIPPRDPRWKVGLTTVKLPFEMPDPTAITKRDLTRKGIHLPFPDGGLEVTQPNESKDKALQEGNDWVKHYVKQDPQGNMAQVVCLIEWDDPAGRAFEQPQYWSVAISRYHSSS